MYRGESVVFPTHIGDPITKYACGRIPSDWMPCCPGTIQETVTGSAGVSRARRGPPVFSDLMIHKRLDSSSPALFLALVKGSLLQSGVISFLHAKEGGSTKFFTITLANVLLTKFATDDSEKEVLAGHEQINLNYDKIQLKDEVTGQSACWDILAARSC